MGTKNGLNTCHCSSVKSVAYKRFGPPRPNVRYCKAISEVFKQLLRELKTKAAVQAFADKIGIYPGIVVGRLQHDGLVEPYWMNDQKVSFRFADAM